MREIGPWDFLRMENKIIEMYVQTEEREIVTLKSMLPFPSLSNILKICSTKTLAFPAGRIIEYISKIFVLDSCPSGQSTWGK